MDSAGGCRVLAIRGLPEPSVPHQIIQHDTAGSLTKSKEPRRLAEMKTQTGHLPRGPHHQCHDL